jgi:TolA-binding protein
LETASADQQRFADGLLSRGLHEMAIEEYRRILSDDPEYARLDEVLFRMGEAFRKLKQGPPAERMYLRVVQEFPESLYRDKAAFRRAELYVRNGKYLEAVNLMRALLDSDPDPDVAASAAYYAGYSMKRVALLSAAEQQFKNVIEKYPESDYLPFSAMELASMYRQKSSSKADAEKMYALVASSKASDRVRAEAIFQMGDLAYGEQDFEGAVNAYAKLRKEFPSDPRVEEAILQTGWSYFQTKNWKEVSIVCAEEGRTDPIWQYFRANVLRAGKAYEEAIDAYQVFLTRNPDHRMSPSARYEEALCAYSQEDYERVVTRLKEGSWSAPLATERAWLLAQARLGLKQTAEAAEALEFFLKLEPGSSRSAVSRYELARFDQVAGKLEEAAGKYRALVKDHPDHSLAPQALYAAGFCMAARNDFNQAIKDWNALETKYPKAGQVTQALLQKALAQIRLKAYPSAEATLKKYLKRTPAKEDQVEALYWLGQVHEEKSEPEKAREVYQSALDQASGHPREGSLRFRLAGVVQALGDTDTAAALYQEVLDSPEAKNMPPSLMEWLVRQNLDRGDGPKAVQAAKAMVAGNHEASWNQIAYFLLGKSQALNGARDLSIRAYDTAFTLPGRTPEGVEAGLELGGLLLESGDGKQAEDVLSRVVERSREDGQLPQRAKATFLLGRASELQADFKSAARYFMSMAILYDDPELSPEALYRAAAAYGKSESAKEQKSAINELKSRYPDSTWAKKSE